MNNVKKALIKIIKKIEDTIFPQCCLICGKPETKILCKKCEKNIYSINEYKIEKKNKKENYFDKHVYMFLYKDKIRKLIIDYKFNDKGYLYKLFSENIIKNKKICGILEKYDIIIPIPVHYKRERQRGYNQSTLIAKEIAKNIEGLQLENNVLKKIKNNVAQSSLDKNQRKLNVQDAYIIQNIEKIKDKKVIIFDDIYTTGNTANAVAKLLKENGVSKILVLTIAKD